MSQVWGIPFLLGRDYRYGFANNSNFTSYILEKTELILEFKPYNSKTNSKSAQFEKHFWDYAPYG